MPSGVAKILWTCLGLCGLVVLLFVGLFVVAILLYRTEGVFYEYGPTQGLFKTGDLTAAKLAGCRAGSVVVSPRFFTHPTSEVRLAFYAKQPTAVTLQRVLVTGSGGKEHTFKVDLPLTLDTKTRQGELFAAYHKVELPPEAFGASGLTLVVVLAVEGKTHRLELAIERVVRTFIAWPT